MSNSLLSVAKKLASIHRSCYVVGSFCVHKILDFPFDGDRDLATDATPEEISSVLTVVGEIGKKYGTLIIKENEEIFEITTFRRDIGSVNHRKPVKVIFTKSLEEDAKRRDFTVNAIYYDILKDTFEDPTGGIFDLNAKILRFIGDIDARLDEDILRLLRYIRFRFLYGFTPAKKNYDKIIKTRVLGLSDIAIERIRQEFDKILLLPNNIKALEYLKKAEFFKQFLPEVDALSETLGGPKHHLEGNVWKHTLLSLKALKKLNIPQDKVLLLHWTILLHDIGKKSTFSKDTDGNVHYYDHEKIGSEMISRIANHWKMSFKFGDNLEWLIKYHLHPQKIPKMKKLKVNRLMMHPLFPLLILISMADGKGKKPSYTLPYKKIMQQYSDFQLRLHTTKFFTGTDIMYRYPDLVGPEIGKKVEELNNQILAKI